MIIVDTALKQREADGSPVRVAVIGAGYMGRGIAQQLLTPLNGIRLVGMSSRDPEKAASIFRDAKTSPIVAKDSLADVEATLELGRPVVTDDPTLLCQASQVDLIIECAGQIEFGAQVALQAIDHGKHLILLNAELDATIGPILKHRAKNAGVVLTYTDGDEPGIAMNLYRFVESVGYRPVMAGNIKSFLDPYRNPDTQREFARTVGQDPNMVASYADGTKLSMEMTVVANATGLRVGRRGMFGPKCEHVKDVVKHFTVDQLLQQGLVDFARGAQPGSGAFVVGYSDDPVKREYMRYFKMGDGPLHVFYTPHVLPHLQVAETIGRAALFGDAAVTPLDGPVCDVVAVAKRDLKQGEMLDGKGGFTCYGTIENADISNSERLLPMGLSGGCRLVRAVPKDAAVTYADVDRSADRLCDQLRAQQDRRFFADGAESEDADEDITKAQQLLGSKS